MFAGKTLDQRPGLFRHKGPVDMDGHLDSAGGLGAPDLAEATAADKPGPPIVKSFRELNGTLV